MVFHAVSISPASIADLVRGIAPQSGHVTASTARVCPAATTVNSYRLCSHVEEFHCPECGAPVYVGEHAVEHEGDCFCSRHCAVKPESTPPLKYLGAYPAHVLAQVRDLLDQSQLGALLLKKYRCAHTIRTDKALYDFVQEIKAARLRGSEPLSKVAFDGKLHVMAHALGTHTTVSRVQGSKLKSKREIRIATLFRDTPIGFLKMITVHELAHIKEKAHDKADRKSVV